MWQVLASIGQLEFFYDQAPDVMRSCSMALQLLSVAIGSYLSGALVTIVSVFSDRLGCDWLPQDLNYGRLDLFFLLLAGDTPSCRSFKGPPSSSHAVEFRAQFVCSALLVLLQSASASPLRAKGHTAATPCLALLRGLKSINWTSQGRPRIEARGLLTATPCVPAGLTFVNMLLFLWVAGKYVYKDVPHAQKRYVGGLSLKPPRGPVPPWARAREVSDIPIRTQVGHRPPPILPHAKGQACSSMLLCCFCTCFD
jgi:hypothetical protein